MSLSDLVIRNFEESDIEDFVEYYNTAHADYPSHKDLTVEIASQYIFGKPDYDANSHFLALLDGKIVGSMKGGSFGNVGTLGMSIIPEHRFTGIEEALYESVLGYFKSKKFTEMTVSMPTKFERLIEFYLGKSFHVWKYNYDMTCHLSEELPALPELHKDYDIQCSSFPEEKDEIAALIELCFQDDMEETTGLLKEFERLSGEEFFDETGLFVAKKKSTEKIVGISYNILHPARRGTGWVPWLAVLKDDRRKGLGKALLMAGLEWIKENGCGEAKLGVDLETPHAVKLYKDCGFKVDAEWKILKGVVPYE
jgi:GNAT superfamily N-acetyltransferase